MSDDPKKHWQARPFLPDDEAAIPPLYEAVSGHFDKLYWKWMFKDNPFGQGHIWLAEDLETNALVGQYAIIPTDMMINGRKITGSQAIGARTLAAYRKQGIFTGLAKKLFQDSSLKGVDLVYGFPNKNSTHGHVKYLDFFILFQPRLFSRPLDPAILLKRRLKPRYVSMAAAFVLKSFFNLVFPRRHPVLDPSVKITLVDRFPNDFDAICCAYNKTYKNMVARSVKYLNWRYPDRPDKTYRIYLAYKEGKAAGYCVYGHAEREGINVGLIMDLYADHPTLQTLIRHVLDEMEKQGEALASCLVQPGSPILNVLKKNGLVLPLSRFPPYILRLNSDNLKLSEINTIADWHITLGDADFV